MSTRTNILIELGSSRIFVYRHHDGYLSGAGRDLVEMLQQAVLDHHPVTRFIQTLLERRYEQQSYEDRPRPIYEITNDWHGDIEFAYRVVFPAFWSRNQPKVQVGWRSVQGPPAGEVSVGSLDGFEIDVAAEERAAAKAHAAYLASQGR